MNRDQKPHSRDKKVGSGSADLNRGQQVNTGNRPVSGGGRPGASGMRSSGDQSSSGSSMLRGLPIKLNLKTILIIVGVIVVALIVLKMCGGFSANLPTDNPSSPSEGYEDDPNTELDRSVSPLAREKYVTPVGSGNDKFTIMIYMCGTDLESKYGMATSDLNEMMRATISDKVNIIVETGGCSQWKNGVSSTYNQIYKVVSGKMLLLNENAGTKAMTDPDNLTTFINYCTKNYSADRYALIFWDHGGGSVSGYGYDEKNPKVSSMTLDKINYALKNADCKFDFIGYDACLMATLENALVCEKYADYLLASEETEPGTGWYYTRWLTELSNNTSKPTIDVAKTIIDDFVTSSSNASANAKVTLSLIDLAELHGTVPTPFTNFATSTSDLIETDYQQVSSARAGVRQFAESSKINQVDLIDLANRVGTSEASALASALKGAIKYNRSTISRSYGVSVYFPYENTKTVGTAVASYENLDLSDEYADCIKSFASLELGGQLTAAASQTSGGSGLSITSLLSTVAGGSSTSPLSLLSGMFSGGAGNALDASSVLTLLSGMKGCSIPNEYAWVDTDLIADHAEDISKNYIDPSKIKATEKNGQKVLSLSDAEWSLIETVELNVFAKDGNGYIDLGYDNTFDLEGNDLLLNFDGTWLTLNGQVCAYYLLSDIEQVDGSFVTTGYIPALLNGTHVELQVVFDKNNPDGVITGAYPAYANGETDVLAKGMIEIKKGDEILLLCDYYNEDGSYNASFTLGSKFTVNAEGLSLVNLKVNAADFRVTYRLTDIYGNHFWIEVK